MKKYKGQLLKFEIDDAKVTMEIKIKDLVWLFHNSPGNVGDGGNPKAYRIKKDKQQEFAQFVVEMLLDDSPEDGNNTRWGQPLEDIFDEIFCGDENFCKYPRW